MLRDPVLGIGSLFLFRCYLFLNCLTRGKLYNKCLYI